jgi:LAO/AO transport system kinase
MDLAQRLLSGDMRALARAISMVERKDPDLAELLLAVRPRAGRAHVVGITGPPGGGKSTLADGLIERWRAQGRSVGVLAVDPSSPFTGGAILGDRVRMQRHTLDSGVFIRSMAARGHLGGLAAAAREAIRLIDAAGRDLCLIETVGVGQSELEVMHTVDTVVVVTTPTSGDGVQMIKAGIMEIPDVFVLNKADLPGADRMLRELRAVVHEAAHSRPKRFVGGDGGDAEPAWEPPVIRCIASEGTGVDELVAAIDRHREHIEQSGELQRRRVERYIAEVESIVAELAVQRARTALRRGTIDVPDDGDLTHADPYAVASQLLDSPGPG